MSELLLVAVPGVHMNADGALLRVLMVPRLTGPGTTLESYGLTDWPGLVRNATFSVRLRSESGADLEPFDVACHSDGDSTVWQTFFQPQLEVKPFAAQRTYDDPAVDETTLHAGRIAHAYRESVVHRGDPDVVRRQLAQLTLDEAPRPPVDVDAPIPEFKAPDFHRAIALLREHPHVLRALGLIVDVRIPIAQLDRAGDRGEVALDWPAAPSGVGTAHGRATAYERGEGRFLPRSTRTIARGLVDLGTRSPVTTIDPVSGASTTHEVADWVVTSLDVDAAVARIGDAKRALAADTGPRPTLPALRTAGLTLLRRGRGEELARRNERARDSARRASGADGPALTADDLVLGYRLDVRLPGHEWHSLTRRKATYTVAPIPTGSGPNVAIGGPVVEEGHVKPAAGVIGTDGKLRGDETVARWAGTNLAVPPRPPALLPAAPELGAEPDLRHERMPYDFFWTFDEDPDAPADLELKFGTQYQLRARVLDIAGGGLDLDDPPRDRAATPPYTYGRQEPVPPPVIPPPPGLIQVQDDGAKVDDTFFGPGGSLDVLVVRSDPEGDEPHPEFGSIYPPNETRMLLPPAVPFALAEQHGVLSGDGEATVRLARRAMAPPRASAEARNGRHYTWLPDPVIDGVSVTANSLTAGVGPSDVAIETWGESSWPDHAPKTLQLSADSIGEPPSVEWNPIGTVDVTLPPAMQADVEVSSSLRSGVLDEFAAGAWILAAQAAASTDAPPSTRPDASRSLPDLNLQSDTTSGRHPTVTPPRVVRVVHAVRRPLALPRATLQASRLPADTGVALRDPSEPLLGINRDSTVQVDVVGSWDEWNDSPEPQRLSEVVQSLPVGLADAELPVIRHEFGDTKYRKIAYRLTARSRFRQFFAEDDPDSAFTATAELSPVDVPSTVRPVPPVVVSIVPAFRWADAAPDEPRTGLIVDAASLGIGEGEPASGGDRPEAPAEASSDADETVLLDRTRSGGRLRVELGRPWFTTGEGERLAVVLSSGGAAGSTEPETNLYRDPLYGTPPPPNQPTASTMTSPAFPVVLVDDPNDPEHVRELSVALFEVRYDDGRPYADVFLPGGDVTYCPMVRLALARYQEHSLAGLKLSRTITSEAVPLLPSRTLRVERRPGGLVVTLAGTAPQDTPNRVEARLEVAPSPNFAGTLSALSENATPHGWQHLATAVGVINRALDPIQVPADGRSHRLVVTETENLELLDPPSISDALTSNLSRRVVFVDVVSL